MAALLTGLLLLAGTHSFAAKPLHIPLAASQVSLNPISIQDQSSLWVSRQINCQLIRFEKSQLKMEAASAINWSDDKTLRIHLAKSLHFHNGKPVLTRDLVASLNYLWQSRAVLRNIFEWMESINPVDDFTVEIKLKRKVPNFLRVLSSPNYSIFAAEFLEQAKKNPDLWKKPMGCGHYRVEQNQTSMVSLMPLDSKMRPITFHLSGKNEVKESDLALFDIVGLPIVGGTPLGNQYRVIKIFDPYHIFLGLNTTKSPWKNRQTRCAFFASLDRTPVFSAYGKSAEPASDILPRGVTGFSNESEFWQTLKSQSKAGNKLPTLTQGFKLELLGVSIAETYRSAFETMIKTVYDKTSMHVIENPKHFGEEFLKRNSDAMVLGLKSNYLDGYEYLLMFKENDANFTGHWDQKLIDQIDASQMSERPNDRAKLYQKITQQIRDQCLLYPIITIPTKDVYVRQGIDTPGIGTTPLNEYYLGDVK